MPSPLVLLGAAELVVSEEEFIAPDQFGALWDRDDWLAAGEEGTQPHTNEREIISELKGVDMYMSD